MGLVRVPLKSWLPSKRICESKKAVFRFQMTYEGMSTRPKQEWHELAQLYRARLTRKIAAAKMSAVTMNGAAHLKWLMENYPIVVPNVSELK